MDYLRLIFRKAKLIEDRQFSTMLQICVYPITAEKNRDFSAIFGYVKYTP